MKYKWVKGYKYTKIPVYLISFWKIKLFQTGVKKKRVGVKMSSDEDWKKYLKMIEEFYEKS